MNTDLYDAVTWRRCCGLAAMLFVVLCVGCQNYGTVSPAAYDYSMALYSISSRQDSSKLEEVSQQIAAAETAGELSSREAGWLLDIVDDGRNGNWKAAGESSRRIMEDQVHRSNS